MRKFVVPLSLVLLIELSITGSIDGWGAKKYYPKDYILGLPSQPEKLLLPDKSSQVLNPVPLQSPAVVVKTVVVSRKEKTGQSLVDLVQEQRYYEALRQLDQRLQKQPNSLNWQLLRAQVLRLDGQYDQAAVQYNQILKQFKSSSLAQAKALNGLGLVSLARAQRAYRSGDTQAQAALTEEARSFFAASLQKTSRLADTWIGLAEIGLLQGRLTDAESALEKALKIQPNHPSALLVKGEWLLARQKPEEAQEAAYAAEKAAPNDSRTKLLLGRAAMEMGHLDDAIIHLKKLVERIPQHAEALQLLSRAYELKMKPQEAEQALQRAVDLNPMDPMAVYALMKLYDQGPDLGRSVSLLQQVLDKTRPFEPQKEAIRFRTLVQGMLLQKYMESERWEEAYQLSAQLLVHASEALKHDSGVLPGMEISEEQIYAYYAQAAYLSGQFNLYGDQFLQQPATQIAIKFLEDRLRENPDDPVSLTYALMIHPLMLTPMSDESDKDKKDMTLTTASASQTDVQPYTALAHFLAGDRIRHQQVLERFVQQPDVSFEAMRRLAEQLYHFGDHEGVAVLLSYLRQQQQSDEFVQQLEKELTQSQKDVETYLKVLKKLNDNIPSSYWERVANDAFQIARNNARLHGLVADYLAANSNLKSALWHQRLASQYAETPREKKHWESKLRKTEAKLRASQS